MKIHHVGFLAVNGKETVKGFLEQGAVLEQKESYDSFRKINITFILMGEYRIEIIEPADENSPFYPLLKKYKNSPYHFCYEVNELEPEMERLQKNGCFVLDNPMEAPCIDNRKVAFLMSPNMGVLELVENKR